MRMKPRLVVKVGTHSLLGGDSPRTVFETLSESVRHMSSGYDVMVVTSGAIGFGMREQALTERPTDVHVLQAFSMLGQVGLLRHWREAMEPKGIGQVLVTSRELHDEHARHALVKSLEALWELGAIPVVNENDAVTTEEITFGDNDKLAAEVAVLLAAESLVLLTDQEGICEDFGSTKQRVLKKVSLERVQDYVKGGSGSGYGKGGADSKVYAARLALSHGVRVFVGLSARPHGIEDILAGCSGTQIYQGRVR